MAPDDPLVRGDTVRGEVMEGKELKSGRVRLELKPGPKAAKPPSKK